MSRFFDLYLSVDVNSVSLRMGGSYLWKDKANNRFHRMLSRSDYMSETVYEVDGQIKPLTTARERRRAWSGKLPYHERLSQQGSDFFHNTFEKIGPFKFVFYEHHEDPLEKPVCTIKLGTINTSYVIQSGILTAVTR